jgi:hypothetical protein
MRECGIWHVEFGMWNLACGMWHELDLLFSD